MKLSVALATYNEEGNLPRCLESVKSFADEIVVVDGSSEDKTRQIARRYGARVIKTVNRPMFHTNKQMAIDAASSDWILQLDADEQVDEELAKEIVSVIKKGSPFSAFAIKRKNFFLGTWLHKGGQYPDPVIRLFRKGKAYLPQRSVHEKMEVKGRVEQLNGHLRHFTAPTFSRYLTNANRYTSLTAEELNRKKLALNSGNFLEYFFIRPLVTFVRIYIRHKGFLDGFPGFIFALFSGLHWQIAYMKYWEAKYTTNHPQENARQINH